MSNFMDIGREWTTYKHEVLPEEGAYIDDLGKLVGQPTVDQGLTEAVDPMCQQDFETRQYITREGEL